MTNPKTTLRRPTQSHNFWLDVTRHEKQALSLLRPFNPRTIDPAMYLVEDKQTYAIYNYFRVALSSEPQEPQDAATRVYRAIIIDRTSGTFLGLFSVASPVSFIKLFKEEFGWDEHIPLEGNPRVRNAREYKRARSVLKMMRCLPLYEFGDLLGGKLLTMLAMCHEFIRLFEVRFSYPFVAMHWTTLHGRAAQYSRMERNHVHLLGIDEHEGRERGVYVGYLRRNYRAYLQDETDDAGRFLTMNFEDTVAHWKERWYLPRLERMNVPDLIVPDIDAYRVSDKLASSRIWEEE